MSLGLVATAGAELLPLTLTRDAKPLRLTFEILPADPSEKLADDLLTVEGGRLVVEQTRVGPNRYLKSALILPLPSGDTRERVVFFAEEGERLRMLGFHRIHRHHEAPSGETIVFNPGPTNPLKGSANEVPADTYTYGSLLAALGGIVSRDAPLTAHLWLAGDRAVPVEISSAGREELSVLGTVVKSRRVRVRPEDAAAGEAVYWLSDDPPHSFLQYRGPAELLLDDGTARGTVLLKATSSSEQVNRLFGGS